MKYTISTRQRYLACRKPSLVDDTVIDHPSGQTYTAQKQSNLTITRLHGTIEDLPEKNALLIFQRIFAGHHKGT